MTEFDSSKYIDVKRVVDGAADPALLIDLDQRVHAVNHAAQELLELVDHRNERPPCYRLFSGCNPAGESICRVNCSTIQRLREGKPSCHPELQWGPNSRTPAPFSLSTLLLPTQPDPLALLLIRPIYPEKTGEPVRSGRKEEAVLAITVLGSFRIFHYGGLVPHSVWARPGCLNLLKLLIAHRHRPMHREEIVETLWPEVPPNVSLARLKVLLHNLKQGLARATAGMDPDVFIRGRSELLSLDLSHVFLDVQVFDAWVERAEGLETSGLLPEAYASYQAASALFQGDFLSENPYATWADEERTRLRGKFAEACERAAALAKELKDGQGAVKFLRKALQAEPWRERAHFDLMLQLHQSGRRNEAAMQYHTCCQALRLELGADPSGDTTTLYRRILSSDS